MRLLNFTFKNEAIWMLVIGIGLPVIGALLLLTVYLMRYLMR